MVIHFDLKSQLQEGLLNRSPLPFEQTVETLEKIRKYSLQDSFLRNLHAEEIGYVLEQIHRRDEIQKVAKIIQEGAYSCSFFKEDRFAQFAMGAYALLQIQRNELANLLLRYSAYLQFGQSFQVYREEDRDYARVLENGFFKISLSEREQFREGMKKLAPSERIFWTITLPSSQLEVDKTRQQEWPNWFFTVEKLFPFFSFNFHPTIQHHKTMVIPTIGIYQVFLRTIFKENAIRLEPELMKTSEKNIQDDLLQNRWPVALNFPGLERIEKKADGYQTGEYGISHHDFYHAYRISTIPFNHRDGFFRQKQILIHSLALKTMHPNVPLLKMTWLNSDGTVSIVSSDASIEELKTLEEGLTDLERVATPYARIWVFHRSNPLYDQIDDPSFTQPFAQFSLKKIKLRWRNPESLPFQYAALIHDMVIHKHQWWQCFRIYPSEELSRWKTESELMVKTLYEGFKV